MKKWISIVLILALVIAMGGLYVVSSRRQADRKAELESRAVKITSNSTSTSSVSTTEESTAATSEQSAASSTSDSNADKAAGISIRGDSYNTQGTNDKDSYAIDLANLLTMAGVNISVEDNTVDMAGTLTQLTYAGVSKDEVNAYIKEHQSNPDLAQSSTETTVRSDTKAQANRDDQNYIPVIFMGYYGGWGQNTDELIKQQQNILDTYTQQDKYVIVGYYPDGYVDRSGYDKAMKDHWGDHYFLMNPEIKAAAMTTTGRQEMAQAIFNKLKALGYI